MLRDPVVKRVARRSSLVWLVVALLLTATMTFVVRSEARAQVSKSAPAASNGGAKSSEEEASDSPRASMRNFLDLAEKGRYQEAAIYLDVSKPQEKRSAELTSKLYAVLSQRLLVDPEHLSPLAQGRTTDGLPATVEELGKIDDAKGHPVPIRIIRHESKAADDEPRWVFAQSTVSHIDGLYGALRDRWMRETLPSSLLTEGPMALYYWQWLALPLLGMVCLAWGRFLTFLSGVVARRLLSQQPWSERLLQKLRRPATIGWALACFAFAMPYLALTLRAEDLLERGLRAVGYLTFFWALVKIVGLAGDEINAAQWAASRPSARSLSAVGVKLGKVVVAALALMVALSELGYPVTSVIAGLGIGGVALALAAQKTVENLFGSVSILADQPFRVGDTIRVDTIEGTVESIGLRSTRVRTVDRTVVIFPNGKLADMRIESLGPRERIRFTTKLQLSRATTVAQIESVRAAVKKRLDTHGSVKKEDVSVRLIGIGEASYDIEVAAPIETLDANEFAKIREELLVAFIDIVETSGATLAVPTRQVLEGSATATKEPGANGTKTTGRSI
jgi:MscS family membrane protein